MALGLLFALVVFLAAGLAVTGYALHREKKEPEGVRLAIGKQGLSIRGK